MLTIDAVLPVTISDAPRARILLRSLGRFFQGLGTCWVMAPDQELGQVREALSGTGTSLQVLPDSELVPELGSGKFGAAKSGKPYLRGWMIPQLAKIGIAARVQGDFYLTLAADVLCTRPVRAGDLIIGDRALATVLDEKSAAADAVHRWYQDAGHVLGLPVPKRFHGVCPALVSTEGMLRMQEYLARRSLWSGARRREGAWRRYLIRHQPWTEHALYGTFLDAMGLFDRYHLDGGPAAFYGNCVWEEADLPRWDPARSFAPDAPGGFSVVQSNAGITADGLWKLVSGFLA